MGRKLAAIVVTAISIACGSSSPSSDEAIVASVDFEVTPAEIALGDVGCGATRSSEITITNRGGATLTYSVSLPDRSPFVLKAEPEGTLASGAKATLAIDITPSAAGDVQDTATIDVNGIVQQVALRARGVGAVLVADPALVDFGEVRFDRTSTHEVILRNVGNAPATIDGFDGAAEAISVGPAGATIAPGATTAFTATIGAGAVTGAPVKVATTARFAANTAHCGAPPTIDITALRVNADVTLSVADFGQQPCGVGTAGTTRDVVITNYALEPIVYTAALPAGSSFEIVSGGNGTIPAATSATATTAAVKLAIAPTGVVLGFHEEELTLQISPLAPPSGGTRTTKVRLDVRGAVVSVTPESADFSSNGKNTDSEKLTVKNDGNEAVTLAYELLTRNETGVWSVDTNLQPIPAKESRQVTVRFKALSGGGEDYDAELAIKRESGATVCNPFPRPRFEGEKK